MARIFSSRTLHDSNNKISPIRIHPVDSEEKVQPGGWTHILPHASVTVISLTRNWSKATALFAVPQSPKSI
jgi:hypothetical protein